MLVHGAGMADNNAHASGSLPVRPAGGGAGATCAMAGDTVQSGA